MSKDVPLLRTELPGPKGRALIEADERVTSPSYTRAYPLAVARGEGCVIEDLDGNRFLDFNAGIAVCATGHCHPRVVKAVQEQAGRLLHYSGTDFYYDGQAELSNKLAAIAPGDSPKRVYLANSGAESVEAAIKLARHHTGRSYVIAFRGAFHGRTMGALSLTCSKRVQRERFGPLLPGVIHVDYPACYRCPVRRGTGFPARANSSTGSDGLENLSVTHNSRTFFHDSARGLRPAGGVGRTLPL